MSDSGETNRHRQGWLARAFESPRVGEMSWTKSVVVYAILILWSLFILFPLYWVLITSLKQPIDIDAGPVFVPWLDFTPSLHAWRETLVDRFEETTRPFVNSLIIASAATFLCMLAGSMAAYALARSEFRPKFAVVVIFVVAIIGVAVAVGVFGAPLWFSAVAGLAIALICAWAIGRRFQARLGNGDILFWILSQRIMPPVVVVVPIYMMFQKMHLLDTHAALIICYMVVNLPIAVWLLFDFFNSIPIDLEESAELDGASRFRIFAEIILPLSRTGLAATTLLVLILTWNEYVLALFLSTARSQTMPILVAGMTFSERGVSWWNMCVIITLMIVPVILMALVLQRFISKGVLLGAVKG